MSCLMSPQCRRLSTLTILPSHRFLKLKLKCAQNTKHHSSFTELLCTVTDINVTRIYDNWVDRSTTHKRYLPVRLHLNGSTAPSGSEVTINMLSTSNIGVSVPVFQCHYCNISPLITIKALLYSSYSRFSNGRG